MALLLMARLIALVATRDDGRAALVLLQFMPVAFIFRVRDNHEYPMLACLMLVLLGLEGLTTSWRGLWLVVVGFSSGLLIKGVFVVVVLLGAALWILVNPARGSRGRGIIAVGIALVTMGAVAVAYDAWYLRETGQRFWSAYWQRQLAPMSMTSPVNRGLDFLSHLGFYGVRLLFHPAPWSLVLLWAGRRVPTVSDDPARERRAFRFALLFTATSLIGLSLAGRFAERYIFSTTYVFGGAGAVAAYRVSPTVRTWLAHAERRIPALPAITWTALVVLRLAAGHFLPRI
jgi:4-amino-4-deoxy-L-arabinose transferase-like glycosyltransferase